MNSATYDRSAPRQLLPAFVRFAIAVAVGLVLTTVWIGAESASEAAVRRDQLAFEQATVRHVQLPRVEIAGKRDRRADVVAQLSR